MFRVLQHWVLFSELQRETHGKYFTIDLEQAISTFIHDNKWYYLALEDISCLSFPPAKWKSYIGMPEWDFVELSDH